MLSPRDGAREVQAQLDRYLGKLPVRAEAVVLVGSRARGTHWRGSDIDLVVVSRDFEGMSRGARIDLLLQPWYDLPPLEPFGFTPEELDGESLYLWEALADGLPLLDSGVWEAARERFRRRIEWGEVVRTERGWRVVAAER